MSLSYNITKESVRQFLSMVLINWDMVERFVRKYMICVFHEKIWRRVYCTCWANSGTFWITYKGERVNINSTDLIPR